MGEQIQNYQVNYGINVTASGVDSVTKLSDAVKSLKTSHDVAESSVKNIQMMMDKLDAIFRPKGKKRDFKYKIEVDTKGTEAKLSRVNSLLESIKANSEGIKLVINAGEKLDSKSVRSQAQAILNSQLITNEKEEATKRKKATKAMRDLAEPINNINKTIGKVNAALINLQTGREINIKTDVAKERLLEILSLMNQIKGASKMVFGMQMGSPQNQSTHVSNVANGIIGGSFAYSIPSVLSNRIWGNQQQKLIQSREKKALEKEAKEQDKILKKVYADQEKDYRSRIKKKLSNFNKITKEEEKAANFYESVRLRSFANKLSNEKEQQKQEHKSISNIQKAIQRQSHIEESVYGGKRKTAINRLQYTKAPSWRSMPFAGMVSSYMAYGLIKSELGSAVEYANIMESARSILKVADSDLSTFDERFDKMSKNVRQIGVDTKFTAQEIGAATKYLAMAGMDIETINNAMRPITNLALIGDADVSQIADLTTNIMSGYNIKSTSLDAVADILASTTSRSNVNVIEMSESYKMAAGYLKMAGVDFAESSAAIGILGNSGIKGTMGGTALRAMSTRFAKPTKEAQDTLNRLGVKFTEFHDVYGKQVEKLKPLADIFEELNTKGATMGDMQAVFGKIGGNAAMMFINKYEELRTLSNQNQASHGISSELAKVKQEDTKGLWAQMTSQFSESFMQAYEIVEPQLRSVLKDLLERFKPKEFAEGIASIGRMLLDIFSTLGKFGTWVIKNYNWIEPLLFTGFVATKIFKLAGALTNLGVALGFIGKQAVGAKALGSIGSIVGVGEQLVLPKTMSFASKRALISTLKSSGMMGAGKGAATQALANVMTKAGSGTATSTIAGLFSSQVATGTGLIGAGSSIAAIGTGAVAATAGIAALVGILGYVGYKMWQVKKAKDAVNEEINSNRKYRYPSLDALYGSLKKSYDIAISAKGAINDLTSEKTLEETSGKKVGKFTGNWLMGVLNMYATASAASRGVVRKEDYNTNDAYQDDIRDLIATESQKEGQRRINSFYARLGKQKSSDAAFGFVNSIRDLFGVDAKAIDTKLFVVDKENNKVYYKDGLEKMTGNVALRTPHFARYINEEIVPEMIKMAREYAYIMHDRGDTQGEGEKFLQKSGLDFEELEKLGLVKNSLGKYEVPALKKNATEEERKKKSENDFKIHSRLSTIYSIVASKMGGNADIAKNILEKVGFSESQFANEPDYDDKNPWNKPGITESGEGGDDGGAGGNYSGTGKLSSAAPKQVIVNITNLLSIQTVELMKTPEGKSPEVQDLKEMMAQALIDVVHDFDASWNG